SYTMSPLVNPVDPATGSDACQGEYFGPITVPDDHLWLMGDNRTNSLDSRGHVGDELQGTIPVENVVGKVSARVLPSDRIGGAAHPDIQAWPWRVPTPSRLRAPAAPSQCSRRSPRAIASSMTACDSTGLPTGPGWTKPVVAPAAAPSPLPPASCPITAFPSWWASATPRSSPRYVARSS